MLGLATAVSALMLLLGGRANPRFQDRLFRAWALAVVLTLLLCWVARLPLVALPAAIALGVVSWATYRGLGRPGHWKQGWPFAVVAVLLAVTGAWGAASWYDREWRMPPGDCSELEGLKLGQARADAERSVARGDTHVLGVMGYGLMIEGAPMGYEPRHRVVHPIECTSDAIFSRRHARLNALASAYAEIYNRRVFELSAEPTR